MYHFLFLFFCCCICISSVNAQAGLYDMNFTLLYGSCPVCVSVRNLNLGTGASRGLNEGTSE